MFKKILILCAIPLLFISTYAKELGFSGQTSYQRSGSTVTLVSNTIHNNRDGGTSGTLKLMLWATPAPYDGENINGFVVAQTELGSLLGNTYFPNISRTVSFLTPSAGSYFMTLTLSEYRDGHYQIVDYMNYSNMEAF